MDYLNLNLIFLFRNQEFESRQVTDHRDSNYLFNEIQEIKIRDSPHMTFYRYFPNNNNYYFLLKNIIQDIKTACEKEPGRSLYDEFLFLDCLKSVKCNCEPQNIQIEFYFIEICPRKSLSTKKLELSKHNKDLKFDMGITLDNIASSSCNKCQGSFETSYSIFEKPAQIIFQCNYNTENGIETLSMLRSIGNTINTSIFTTCSHEYTLSSLLFKKEMDIIVVYFAHKWTIRYRLKVLEMKLEDALLFACGKGFKLSYCLYVLGAHDRPQRLEADWNRLNYEFYLIHKKKRNFILESSRFQNIN
jgi:hypothetical protein